MTIPAIIPTTDNPVARDSCATRMKPEPMADPTPTNEHLFAHSREALTAIADDLLSIARQNGASASEVEISEGFGQSVPECFFLR